MTGNVRVRFRRLSVALTVGAAITAVPFLMTLVPVETGWLPALLEWTTCVLIPGAGVGILLGGGVPGVSRVVVVVANTAF
jgi:hypothetical protein